MVAHGWRHRPKLPADYDDTHAQADMSHDERREFDKREAKVLRYDGWYYSLACDKNVRYYTKEEEERLGK